MHYLESETRSTGKWRLSCLESCRSCDPAPGLTLAGSLPPRTKLVLNRANGSKPHSQGPCPPTSTFLTFLTAESKVTLILSPPLTLCGLWGWHHQVRGGGLQPEELGTDDAQEAVSPTFSIRVIFMLNGVSSSKYVLITKPSLSPGSETIKGR